MSLRKHPASLIVLVSAPSGAGKTSLVRELMVRDGNLKMGISHTTRPLRGEERDGHDYYFVSRQEFLAMRERGEFLESAEVFGHLYGTSRPMIEALACDGSDVVLEIDTQGAAQLRAKGFADASVFILPPALDSLANRLAGRASDAKSVIDGRLAEAKREMSQYKDYDYVLVNEDFEAAARALGEVIRAERCRTRKVEIKHDALLRSLTEGEGI